MAGCLAGWLQMMRLARLQCCLACLVVWCSGFCCDAGWVRWDGAVHISIRDALGLPNVHSLHKALVGLCILC
jgi:hypothetical protein